MTSRTVVPSLAGPKRPQDRVALTDAQDGLPRGARQLTCKLDKLDDEIADTFPASDPFVAERENGGGTERAADTRRARRKQQAVKARRRDAGRRHHDVGRPRVGRDRGDHLVHQHLQPVGHDRRGAAGQEGRRGGAGAQAVGEDHAGARLQGRHGLLRAGRPDAVPGEARLQPGRLRLHHLHRQLRSAAGGDQRRGRRERPRGRLGAVRATGTSRAGSTRTSR